MGELELELELEAMAPIEHAGWRAREWECYREERCAYTILIRCCAAANRRRHNGLGGRRLPLPLGAAAGRSTAKGVVDKCRFGGPRRRALLD